MKNVTDFYNKTATGWSDEFLRDKKQSTILEKFYNCYSQGGTAHPKILDLGCGAGYDSKILHNFGARVVGIDISDKLIDIAKKQVPECKFFVGDITDKLSALGKFDGVLCLATLIHVDIQNMKKTFDNIAEILKKGGLFLLSVCDGTGKNAKKSYVKIDGVSYDKDFNNYNASELCAFAYPKLKLVDTWRFDDFLDGWRYYVFMKQ